MTLKGWTSPEIAEVFCVREDMVRFWLGDFARDGIQGIKASVYAGPHPLKTEAPELNDIDVVWHHLKAHLAHQTFTDVGVLDREIHAAVEALNTERNVDSLVKYRISIWIDLD